jgi:hypothetical protein
MVSQNQDFTSQPAEVAEDVGGLGVIVYGRRTFEPAEGWGGNHPTGKYKTDEGC